MLLEVITRTKDCTETERYISVRPESLQIRKRPELTDKIVPVDTNPQVLTFIGKPMSYLDQNATLYNILLTNSMSFRLLTEQSEKLPRIDLSILVKGEPTVLFKGIKIQRTNGLIYRANDTRITLGFKYKEMTTDYTLDKIPTGKFLDANLELFSRTFNMYTDDVKEMKLMKI